MVKIEKMRTGYIGVRTPLPYNAHWARTARELGGKWDHQEQIWIFREEQLGVVQEKVDQLYLLPTSEYVDLRITAKKKLVSEMGQSVDFFGFSVVGKLPAVKAPIVAKGVRKVHGEMSLLNDVVIVQENAEFILHKMPVAWVFVTSDEWAIQEAGPRISGKDALQRELAFMEKRVLSLKELLQQDLPR